MTGDPELEGDAGCPESDEGGTKVTLRARASGGGDELLPISNMECVGDTNVAVDSAKESLYIKSLTTPGPDAEVGKVVEVVGVGGVGFAKLGGEACDQ